jgi:hypothetical protein
VLTAARALALNVDSSPELPRVSSLQPLYNIGWKARQNDLIMVAGAPKSQKSAFTMYYVVQMGLPTLYFAADMTGFEASIRLACMTLGLPTERVEQMMKDPEGKAIVLAALESVNITYRVGAPITWRAIDAEIEAWVELHNSYPPVIVFDNLLDFDGAETSYEAQSAVMSDLTAMKEDLGSTIFILHHCTDKPRDGREPMLPPARASIKNGLGEKPTRVLTVATDASDLRFRAAPVAQRDGVSDPTGNTFAVLQSEPQTTRFYPVQYGG